MGELTPKQARFVEAYLVDLNATQAARRAGYSARNGWRLLNTAPVQAAVQAGMAARSRATGITAERVLEELAKVAFSDLRDVTRWGVRDVEVGFDAKGKRLPPDDIGEAAQVRQVATPYLTLLDSRELTPEAAAAVAEVVLGREGLRVKLHSKVAALAEIGRHLGVKTQVEHGGKLTLEDLVAASLAPPDEDTDGEEDAP